MAHPFQVKVGHSSICWHKWPVTRGPFSLLYWEIKVGHEMTHAVCHLSVTPLWCYETLHRALGEKQILATCLWMIAKLLEDVQRLVIKDMCCTSHTSPSLDHNKITVFHLHENGTANNNREVPDGVAYTCKTIGSHWPFRPFPHTKNDTSNFYCTCSSLKVPSEVVGTLRPMSGDRRSPR